MRNGWQIKTIWKLRLSLSSKFFIKRSVFLTSHLISIFLSKDDYAKLDQLMDNEEIRNALLSMGPSKPPGPDGFMLCFINPSGILCEQQSATLLKFFSGMAFLLTIQMALALFWFRNVIILRNVVNFGQCDNRYKLITQIIYNRMKNVMSKLVAPMQSNFIPRRKCPRGYSFHAEKQKGVRLDSN